MKFQLTLYHKLFTVEKVGKRVVVQGADTPDQRWEFELSASASAVDICRNGERFFAKVDGQHLAGTWGPMPRGAATATTFDGTIKSPFAGRVTKCTAAPGDRVETGDPLMVIEAMKMEYPVTAPQTGMVEAVLVQVGDQVALDEPLVKLIT